MSFKEKLIKIKNFVFDIDGVFTDGSIIVDNEGNELRVFNTRDGIAVKLALDNGYNICVISGGKNEGVRKRLSRLGVKDIFLGAENKVEIFTNYLNKNNHNLNETMFMGDDLPDIDIIKIVGLSCCPNDAASELREITDYISIKKGGAGCVRDIIKQILKIQGNWNI